MPRRNDLDGPRLTYGGATGSPVRERRSVAPFTVALLVLCLVLSVLLVVTFQRGRTALQQVESAPSASVAQPSPAAPTAAATPSTTVSTAPTPAGSDATEAAAAPVGATEAASRFVSVWLDPDPKTRKKLLPEVATAGLSEQLVDVDPAKIPEAKPVGEPTPGSVNESSATLRQRLSDKSTVSLDLAVEPDSTYGWLVYSISPDSRG